MEGKHLLRTSNIKSIQFTSDRLIGPVVVIYLDFSKIVDMALNDIS